MGLKLSKCRQCTTYCQLKLNGCLVWIWQSNMADLGEEVPLSEVWMCSLYGSKNTILSFSWLHYLEYITVFSISANTSLLNLTHWTSTASLFCVHNRMVGEMTEIHNHPTLRNVCAFCKQGTLKMRQLAQQPQKRMETSSESPPRNGPAPQDTTPSNSSTRYQSDESNLKGCFRNSDFVTYSKCDGYNTEFCLQNKCAQTYFFGPHLSCCWAIKAYQSSCDAQAWDLNYADVSLV